MKVNPRSIGVERPFLTAGVHELAALKAAIVAAGHSAPTAAGLVGWLVDKAAGRPDQTADTTRSRYRQILTELGPERLAELAGSRRRARSVRGQGRELRRWQAA